MADLNNLFAQIPVEEIAGKLGASTDEVNNAVQVLVPTLLGGLHHGTQDAAAAPTVESAVGDHAASGLLDGPVSVDNVDQAKGDAAIAKIFGGNDSSTVASALAGTAGNSDLIKRLLPILAPIVLAYVGKQLSGGHAQQAPATQAASGGGLGDVLGSLLGGATGGGGSGGSNPLGAVLGSVLGGQQGGAIGDILGGLLGGKK
jgi:hypothetical protein